MAFHPSKPAGLVSGSLKFLFSSLLPSEATVSAPSDMLALVHLLGLASSPPPSLSLCYLPAAGAHFFLRESGRQISLEVLSFSPPCVSLSVTGLSLLSFLHPDVIA